MASGSSDEWDDWDGRLFHVTSVLNRESIAAHGLDWTRMGRAPGIAGSRVPEVEGCFLAQDEWIVDFFLSFDANDLVDVWLIEGLTWTELIESQEGFWYLPRPIPRTQLTLYRRDVKTHDDIAG